MVVWGVVVVCLDLASQPLRTATYKWAAVSGENQNNYQLCQNEFPFSLGCGPKRDLCSSLVPLNRHFLHFILLFTLLGDQKEGR